MFNAIVSGADRYLADHYTELHELFAAEHPAGARRGLPGGSSTVCTPACASGWCDGGRSEDEARHQFEEWIAGLPDRLETSPSCASAGSASSAHVLVAPGCGTGPRRCGSRPRNTLRPRRPTRSLSCAAGWRWAGGSGLRLGSDRRLPGKLERVVEFRSQGTRRSVPTTNSLALSRELSSDGTQQRPRASWSCS